MSTMAVGSSGGGDVGAEIAAMILEESSTERKAARETRGAEEAVEDGAENAQVAAMHAKADDIRSAGIEEGMFEIAGGACTIAAGTVELSGATATSVTVQKQARFETTTMHGASTIFGAFGKGEAAAGRAQSADDDAAIATHEHAASHAKRAIDDAREDEKAAQDLARKALDFRQEYEQAQASTNSAALHRA